MKNRYWRTGWGWVATWFLAMGMAGMVQADITNGLVHYWPFDTGQVVDVIGNITGTLENGAQFVTNGMINADNPYAISNDTTQASSGANAGPGSLFAVQGAFTLSGWIKQPTTAGSRLLGTYPSGGFQPGIIHIQLGEYEFRFEGADSNNTGFQHIFNAAHWPNDRGWLGRWQHMVCTLKASASNTIVTAVYLDGVFLEQRDHTTLTFDPAATWFNTGLAFRLGGYNGPGVEALHYVDNFRIYNRALTPTDVKELYASEVYAAPVTFESGLLHHWTFEDGTPRDVIGGFMGTLTNASIVTTPTIKPGNANLVASDPSKNPSGVNAGNSLDFTVRNDWTLSTWVRGDMSYTIFSTYPGGGFRAGIINIGLENWGYPVIRFEGASLFTTGFQAFFDMRGTSWTPNDWHHLVFTLGSDGAPSPKVVVNVVVDGVPVGAQTTPMDYIDADLWFFAYGYYNDPLGLGYCPLSVLESQHYIDNVRLYDRALPDSQIMALYLHEGEAYAASAADLIGWKKKAKIRFAGYNDAETLHNFPALVVLGTNTISGFSYAQFLSAPNMDLRFTAADGTNELSYEIEKWNPQGESYVWVQVPALASSNDSIWVYWGMTNVIAPAYRTNGLTWNRNFKGVWHLAQTSGASAVASAGGVNGTLSNFPDPNAGWVPGKIANGVTFNGSDTIQAASTFGLGAFSAMTISGWVYLSSPSRHGSFVNFGSVNSGYTIGVGNSYLGDDGDGNNLNMLINGVAWMQTGTAIGTGWHHFAMRRGTQFQAYLDGKPVGAAFSAATVIAPTGGLIMGGYADYAPRVFTGELDEIRLSGTSRSANWIWAEWMNQASNSVFNLYSEAEWHTPPPKGTVIFLE